MQSDEPAARLILDRERRAATIILEAACDMRVVDPVQALLREAAEADVRELELDFGRVPFADSTALNLALTARDHVAPKGGRVIVKAPPAVRRIFEVTKTADLFEIVPPSDRPPPAKL